MNFRIAVFAGDGIGPEVMEPCLAVLRRLEAAIARGFSRGRIRPAEFGGQDTTQGIAETIMDGITA